MPDPTQIENMQFKKHKSLLCVILKWKKPSPPCRKIIRSEYGTYTPETTAKIARYAIENGPAKAACHFSEDLGREVTESTIRSTQTLFQGSPSKNTLSVLPYSPRGRPLKLEQYDDLVKAYIRRLRVAGGVVNAQTVITGDKGIVLFKDSTLLQKKMGQD